MNFFSKSVAIVALSGLSSLALANKSGAYVDIGLGMASQDCSSCTVDIGNGVGGKIAAGYRFNDYIAAEVGFAGGQATVSTVYDYDLDASTNTFYGAAVGIFPFAQDFEVFGRLGFGSSRTTLSVDGYEGSDKSSSKVNLIYGLGLGYTQPGTKLTYRVEFNHLSSDSSEDGNSTGNFGPFAINLLSIGVVLGF